MEIQGLNLGGGDGILGREPKNVRVREAREALRSALEDPNLTKEDREELSRVMSETQAKINGQASTERGEEIGDWPRRGSPSPRHRVGWVDHEYATHRVEEDGKERTRFVPEPYEVPEEGLRQLVELADEGWAVEVGSRPSLWFPGRAITVTLERKNPDTYEDSPFTRWLLAQTHREDPVGKLAQDAGQDEDWPGWATYVEDFERYLRERNADESFIDALHRAWEKNGG